VRPTALILTALLAAACSSSTQPAADVSKPATPTSTPTSTSAAGADRCEQVAQDGARVTDTLIDKGCVDSNGAVRLGKVTQCKDGRRLWEMADLIGLSGEPMLSRETKTPDGIHAWALYYRVCSG